MTPKDRGDAIYTFFTDLRSAKEARKRLVELAKSDPEKIVAFGEAAKYLDGESYQLYLEIKEIADRAIRHKSD